jgi:DNA-binding NtrC family response regulator
MERAVALAESAEIAMDDLPPALRGDPAEILLPSLVRGDSMRAWAARYVRLTLQRCGGNRRQACRVLDISYHTLRAYLRDAESARVADTGEEVCVTPLDRVSGA